MKKGFFKTLISVILCAALIFTLFVPALAADECDCGTVPVIQVRGVGETLYDENGNEVFSTENIIAGILPVIPSLTEFLVTQNIDAFVNAASTAANAIFAPVMYDNNFNRNSVVTVNNSSDPVEAYMDFVDMGSEETLAYMLSEELGDNHSYYFVYDWTGNPFQIAADLNDYIQEVKEKSGHDEVSLCAESMGGSITNTYLAVYGYGDVKNVVMSNSAFNGLEMLGQLFIGNPEIDGDALARLISQSIRGSAEYGSLLAYIPIFEQLAVMVNDIFAAAGDRMYEEILIPIFGYIPAFWCFIPEEHYLDAMDFMLQNAGADMQAFALEYYDLVVSQTDERVSEMVESEEVNYFCVSNYNRYIAPVTPSARWNSDGVIETYNTSGFATVADMGETLGDDYVQAIDTGKNMISPDNVVDASTAQAPMQTWFIKNLAHIAYGTDDGTGDFHIWLLTADEQYTVDSNPEYPQFMYYDTEIPMLMPYEYEEEDTNTDNGTNDEENGDGTVITDPDNNGTEDNGDGSTELIPDNDTENENDQSTQDDETNIPNTLVENNIDYVAIAIVMALSVAVIVAIIIMRKKNEEQTA